MAADRRHFADRGARRTRDLSGQNRLRQSGFGYALPSLDGAIRFDNRARTAAADDFGHIVQSRPRAS